MPPLIHFICGSTGAGKTTYAKRLAASANGVRFSIDEWMSALFWPDAPQPIEASWAIERVARCSTMIWQTATGIAKQGVPCVLEIGLTARSERSVMAKKAQIAGLACQFHFLDVDEAERWRRVQARNSETNSDAQLGFAVTREMFDFVESRWEPPTDQELSVKSGIIISG
jgi:predicted kinase